MEQFSSCLQFLFSFSLFTFFFFHRFYFPLLPHSFFWLRSQTRSQYKTSIHSKKKKKKTRKEIGGLAKMSGVLGKKRKDPHFYVFQHPPVHHPCTPTLLISWTPAGSILRPPYTLQPFTPPPPLLRIAKPPFKYCFHYLHFLCSVIYFIKRYYKVLY